MSLLTVTRSPLLEGLNPQQFEAAAAPLNQPVQVLAGAGTGKTFLITARTVDLIRQLKADGVESPEHRVLVLTFTEKAAREMRQRIHKALAAEGLAETSLPDKTITTFHSFCLQLLSRHPLESDRSPDASLISGSELTALFERVLHQVKAGLTERIDSALEAAELDALLPSDVLSLASLKQLPPKERLTWLDTFPTLVEQIKSSGLTPKAFYVQTMAQSHAWFERLQTLPTMQASGEPFESLEAAAAVWARALSGWADDTWHETTQGPVPDAKALKEALEPIKKAYLQGGNSKRKLHPKLDLCFDQLQSTHQLECLLIQQVSAFYALYQQLCQQEGLSDFNDLINQSIELLEQYPTIQRKYQDWFKAVLVDEFQDSNGAQLQLVRLLCPVERPALCVVGDAKQSIYAFRHAQPENLNLVFQGVPKPIQSALQTNYRSVPAILAVANSVSKTITNDASQELVPHKKVQQSLPVQWITWGRPTGEAVKSTGELKVDSVSNAKRREAQWFKHEIVRLLTEENRSPRDIAILVRSHQRADDLAAELLDLNLPVVRSRDLRFFAEPVIRLACAVLSVLRNPADRLALTQLLQARLNDRALYVLSQAYRQGETKTSMTEWLAKGELPSSIDSHRPWVQKLSSTLIEARTACLTETPHQVIEKVFTTLSLSNWGQHKTDLLGFPHTVQHDQISLQQFEQLLKRLSHDQPTLSDLVSRVESEQSNPDFSLPPLTPIEPGQKRVNAIHLLSVHGAKGLEFPVVFVSWLQKETAKTTMPLQFTPQHEGRPGFGLMIQSRQGQKQLKASIAQTVWDKPRAQQEAQRLFYVALTRAEEQLYVSRHQSGDAWSLPFTVTLDGIESRHEIDTETQAWFDTEVDSLTTVDLNKQLAPHRYRWTDKITETERISIDIAGKTKPSNLPIARFSFSGLRQLRDCPLQYQYAKQWRLPEPPQQTLPTPIEIGRIRGDLLHTLIEQHYRQQGELDRLDLYLEEGLLNHRLAPFDKEATTRWLKESYHRFTLSNYSYTALQEAGYRILAPEQRVAYQLPEPVELNEQLHQISIPGQVDVILVNPKTEHYRLLDFKTTTRLGDKQRDTLFWQLRLYRLAFLQANPMIHLPPEQVELVQLIGDESMTPVQLTSHLLPREQADDASVLAWIKQSLDPLRKLSATDQLPSGSNPPCSRCSYQTLCPEKQS